MEVNAIEIQRNVVSILSFIIKKRSYFAKKLRVKKFVDGKLILHIPYLHFH